MYDVKCWVCLVGLLVTFPQGEAEFINSVKNVLDQVHDEKLLSDVQDFVAQEAHHGLQHRMMNKQFSKVGYDVNMIEQRIAEELSRRGEQWSAKTD